MSNKKVLIVTYYWPPAGGPGVQRWLKFVKYLPDFDIEPVVYCPENPNYPLIDNALKSEISDRVTIIKQPIFEPYKFASLFSKKKTQAIASGIIATKKQSVAERLLLYIRGNYFIPDARKFWVKPSVKYLGAYIKKHQINTIITTGPPHSVHLIGGQLKEQLGVNWVADFRDPWTTIGYHKKMKLTTASEKKHKNLERKVLQTADEIIVTSLTTKEEFQRLTKQPISVITNGFDDVSLKKIELDSKFTMAHIGSLLTGRNPEVLWQVLAELIQENTAFKTTFELKLIGAVSDDVLKSIYNSGLKDFVSLLGYISHNDAQIQQRQSQVLLLVEIDSPETRCIIPGKLFEYMQSNRPILAFGPEKSDFKSILSETNTGMTFSYNQREKAAIKTAVLSCFNAYQTNILHVNGVGIQKFHRKNLTQQLALILRPLLKP